MKTSVLIAFVIVLGSCSNNREDLKAKQEQQRLKKNRTFVVGKFLHPNKMDSLFVELVDAKTGKYVRQSLDTNWDKNLSLLIKRDTKLQLVCGKQILVVSEYEQSVGTALIENLGDLNGDRLDEIGFVSLDEDFSCLCRYCIYGFRNNHLVELLNFRTMNERLFDHKPHIKRGNGKSTVLCREYDFEGEAPDYVEKVLLR